MKYNVRCVRKVVDCNIVTPPRCTAYHGLNISVEKTVSCQAPPDVAARQFVYSCTGHTQAEGVQHFDRGVHIHNWENLLD